MFLRQGVEEMFSQGAKMKHLCQKYSNNINIANTKKKKKKEIHGVSGWYFNLI